MSVRVVPAPDALHPARGPLSRTAVAEQDGELVRAGQHPTTEAGAAPSVPASVPLPDELARILRDPKDAAKDAALEALEGLEAGRLHLMTHRWGKGNRGMGAPVHGDCALLALKGPNRSARAAARYLARAIPGSGGLPSSVALFNDLPSTTFNDVIALYDEAIRLAKEDL